MHIAENLNYKLKHKSCANRNLLKLAKEQIKNKCICIYFLPLVLFLTTDIASITGTAIFNHIVQINN